LAELALVACSDLELLPVVLSTLVMFQVVVPRLTTPPPVDEVRLINNTLVVSQDFMTITNQSEGLICLVFRKCSPQHLRNWHSS
jgi:hypothetical protein